MEISTAEYISYWRMYTQAISYSCNTMLLAASCVAVAAGVDIAALLEREMQGKMSPMLASGRGSFYLGGQSLAQNSPVTSLWPVRENETLGFTHPFFRDGRARGEAIVCDEITGCGHSLHGWEFYRNSRVLYGNATIGDTIYVNPAPTSLLWRPDRLTIRYELEAGATIQEVKFFTDDDVLLNIVTLLPSDDAVAAKEVTLSYAGNSYVNTKAVPKDESSKGLPAGTQVSQKRNSTSQLDKLFSDSGCGGTCSAVHVLEKGTAYAKPIDCKFAPFPPGVDCLLKEGKLMYDGMSVFIAASQDISNQAVFGLDADRKATYNFSTTLSVDTPLVMGWVMGDDESATRTRIAKYMSPAAAAAALKARTDAANTFLTTKVPQLNVTLTKTTTSIASAVSWDVHANSTCSNSVPKYKFVSKDVDTLAQCEAVCARDAQCKQVQYQHLAPKWCALYNATSAPHSDAKCASAGTCKWDCVCKGDCPQTPAPGPHPHPPKPSPIPPMNRTLDFVNGYYFGWAMYWLMNLDSQHAPYETIGHAQSAVNNFLGLHLHDSQYYVKLGAWVVPELHTTYAHGNVLMWHKAVNSPMYTNKSVNYWQGEGGRLSKGLLPDNMGATWIASSDCDQLSELIEGAWEVYAKGRNATYLTTAYDLFHTVFVPADGNISNPKEQKYNWGGNGKGLVSLINLKKMATALGKPDDAAAWQSLLEYEGAHFHQQWGRCGKLWGCNDAINSFSSALAPEPYFTDEWAQIQSDAYLMNSVTGHYPPNASYGAILLAVPLNKTNSGPWIAHTTYTYEAIDGLFRHNARDDAIKLTTEHVRDMQRTYGWTIFPEAWSSKGGPWGDQWYNWGSCVSVGLVLERLAGVDYSAVGRADGASSDGVLTVRDFLPPDWERVQVQVPFADGEWAQITVERVNATSKRITVSGNPLGALALQPSLESKTKLVSSRPAGGKPEAAGGRVDWLFVGPQAKEASVVVVWE